MNLLGEGEALQHGEGVGEEGEGPHGDVGPGEDGAVPDGHHGAAVGAGEIVIEATSFLVYIFQIFRTLFTVC